jgi:hypothetical protein
MRTGTAKIGRIGAGSGRVKALLQAGKRDFRGVVAIGLRLTPEPTPSLRKILHDEITVAGIERFEQDEGLVAVMCLSTAQLAGVIVVSSRRQKFRNASEAPGDLVLVVEPVCAKGESIGHEGTVEETLVALVRRKR